MGWMGLLEEIGCKIVKKVKEWGTVRMDLLRKKEHITELTRKGAGSLIEVGPCLSTESVSM